MMLLNLPAWRIVWPFLDHIGLPFISNGMDWFVVCIVTLLTIEGIHMQIFSDDTVIVSYIM